MRPALVAVLVAVLAFPVLVSADDDDCSSESMATLAARRVSARPLYDAARVRSWCVQWLRRRRGFLLP